MIKVKFILLAIIGIAFSSCKKQVNSVPESSIQQSSSESNDLSANVFLEKIKQNPDGIIIDVRSSEEYRQGHIENAINIDINDNFSNKITKLDPSKPVFVYCLSGSRSSHALDALRSAGFQKIYHLYRGFVEWRNANLPESSEKSIVNAGMTLVDYQNLLKSHRLVLVDFYAEWCAPCKKMEPYLNEISQTMNDQVKVVRIDVDKNVQLSKELKIGAVPVLQLYENEKLKWNHTGFLPKEKLIEKIKN